MKILSQGEMMRRVRKHPPKFRELDSKFLKRLYKRKDLREVEGYNSWSCPCCQLSELRKIWLRTSKTARRQLRALPAGFANISEIFQKQEQVNSTTDLARYGAV